MLYNVLIKDRIILWSCDYLSVNCSPYLHINVYSCHHSTLNITASFLRLTTVNIVELDCLEHAEILETKQQSVNHL